MRSTEMRVRRNPAPQGRQRRQHWRQRRGRHLGAATLAALLTLFGATAGQAAPKEGRGKVGGTVTSLTNGENLAGVAVTLIAADGTELSTTTDKRGRFSIKLASGDYLLVLERDGYARFEARLPVLAGGNQTVTVELLDAAEGRRSEAAKAHNAGAEAYRAGDKAAAKASFLVAAEADPTLPDPHRVLAGIYLEEGAWAEAAQAAERFLAAQPGDRQTQLTAYEAYRKLDDSAKVVEMRGVLAADPETAKTLAVHAFNEGAVADQAGDGELAEARFKEALALDGALAAAHFALATLQYRADRYDDAMATLDNGLALEPDSAQGRRLRFLLHDVKGEVAAAGEAMDAYAEVDAAGAAGVLYKRGELSFRNGETKEARTSLLKVIEYWPDHADAHRVLGLAYLTRDAETGKKYLRRFLELAPDDPEAETVKEILASLE